MEIQPDDNQELSRRRTRRLILAGIAVAVIVATCAAIYFKLDNQNRQPQATNTPITATVPETTATLGARTKDAECHINGALADNTCTPGAIIPGATKEQICQPGYSSSVRNVPSSEKDTVYKEYGIASHATGQYEVDHLISLELGGSNEIANLWPEPAEPTPGFHEKDRVENYLHKQVCLGNIALETAQQEVATNWLAVYQIMPR